MAERERKTEREEEAKAGRNEENADALVEQFQVMQQQLQNVLIQKESLRLNIMEIERATEELEKNTDKNAYKIIGPIMVSKPAEEIKKELKDTKEALGVRVKSLESTEKILTGRLKELQEKLKEVIK